MKDFFTSVLGPVLVRALVNASAGAGVVGGDVELQAAGSVALVLSVAWSLWEKRRARKAAPVVG